MLATQGGGWRALRRLVDALRAVNVPGGCRGLAGAADAAVPLSVAAFQVWGANTGVGKSLVSAGLVRQATRDGAALYLKPVQTGFPEDSDARLVAAVSGHGASLGPHAAELAGEAAAEPSGSGSAFHTEFAWRAAVSPHLAVELEGRPVADAAVEAAVARRLGAFAAAQPAGSASLALVETAGGPGSPGPSGRLQADIYRRLRLPALLVGDGCLGGISTTLAAFEMLAHRGYALPALALLQPSDGPNATALARQLQAAGSGARVFALPACQPPPQRGAGETGRVDAALQQWLGEAEPALAALLQHLQASHAQRVADLRSLAERTLACVWFPFTQHSGLSAAGVTTIDARAGEDMLVLSDRAQKAAGGATAPGIEPHFDACASWWTQGVSQELHGRLVSQTLRGVARYGHVMHPNAAIEPTLQLAQLLLKTVAAGWGARVFYSDDGSTAVEVALKMAFRKWWRDHPTADLHGSPVEGRPATELAVIGLEGGYHGDTLGAMDAVAPSVYNGPAQFPWYRGRGLFLSAPYVGLVKGRWQLVADCDRTGWSSLGELLGPARDGSEAAAQYTAAIERAMDVFEAAAAEAGRPARLAACILEPMLQGAGGMLLVDPLYQRCLARVARARRIPLIFDEVFTGLWRLGAPSAAHLLGVQPDIACYAKLLTGGLLPLSATVASAPVFDAFAGDSKLDALLHGHSYSGHAAGASAGVAALRIFGDPALNPALRPGGDRLRELWAPELVERLSHSPRVRYVVPLGTVLAAELVTAEGAGYASGASAEVVAKLRAHGIFARPLGSVVYLMVTPTTLPERASALLQTLLDVLQED